MQTTKNTNAEQNDPRDWRETLPQNWTFPMRGDDGLDRDVPISQHPALSKYPTKDDAVKALVHAQRLIGKRPEGYVQPPAANASPEEREVFFAALGRPDHADGYELPDLELPDNFELDEELRGAFRQKAHELGLNLDQVRGLYEWFLPLNFQAFQDIQDDAYRTRESEIDVLRNVHRNEMPRVLEQAMQAAHALGGEELVRVLNETGAGDRAPVINAFARMAPNLLEGSLKGRSGSSPMVLTEDKLAEMMQDPRYHDPAQRDPDYVRQIQDGFARLFPGEYTPGSKL